MLITVWNDYICPWAYASRPQTDWLRHQAAGRDVQIHVHGFELHPDLPAEGRPVRAGGRLDRIFDHIATECERRDLPFMKPARTPNSRRAMALSELVHTHHRSAFVLFDDLVVTGLHDDAQFHRWIGRILERSG